jgi:hypothetical protein
MKKLLVLMLFAVVVSCSGGKDNGDVGDSGDTGDTGNTGDTGDTGNTGDTDNVDDSDVDDDSDVVDDPCEDPLSEGCIDSYDSKEEYCSDHGDVNEELCGEEFVLAATIECEQDELYLNKQNCIIDTNAEEIKNIAVTYEKYVPEESQEQWKVVTEEFDTSELNFILDQYVPGTKATMELEDEEGNRINLDVEELEGEYEKVRIERCHTHNSRAGGKLSVSCETIPGRPDGKIPIFYVLEDNIEQELTFKQNMTTLKSEELLEESAEGKEITIGVCVDYNNNWNIDFEKETHCTFKKYIIEENPYNSMVGQVIILIINVGEYQKINLMPI